MPEPTAAERRSVLQAGHGDRIKAEVAQWPPLSDAVRADLAILLLRGDHAT